MRLILIRHGESEHSKQGLIAVKGFCPGLTPKGAEQAQRLAMRLRATHELDDCAALLCSGVLRAGQTAEILRQGLPPHLPPTEVLTGLQEQDPGEADGLTHAAFRERYPSFNPPSEPHRPLAPGGESWVGFLERVRAVYEELARRFAGQTVVAATHAGFIVASLLVMFPPDESIRRGFYNPTHTGITEWAVGETWELVRYNDHAHLIIPSFRNGDTPA